MINKLKFSLVALMTVFSLGMAAAPVYAACDSAANCITDGVDSAGPTGGKTDVGDIIKTVVNALLFILGAIAVIMIVIGGIRYTTSNGEAASITSAKNTILYSVIGLVVAMMAYAIVNFVVTNFK